MGTWTQGGSLWTGVMSIGVRVRPEGDIRLLPLPPQLSHPLAVLPTPLTVPRMVAGDSLCPFLWGRRM